MQINNSIVIGLKKLFISGRQVLPICLITKLELKYNCYLMLQVSYVYAKASFSKAQKLVRAACVSKLGLCLL